MLTAMLRQPSWVNQLPEPSKEGLLALALADGLLLSSFLSANAAHARAGTAIVQYSTSSVHTRRIASGEPGSSRCCALSTRELHMVTFLFRTCNLQLQMCFGVRPDG